MSKGNLTLEDQQRLLDNSITVIKNEIYQMRKCLESKHKFMDSLKHASNFLNELRTSSLNPKQYYELYILVYDGLNYLSTYLKDNGNNNKGNSYLIDLYELVQYAGNIIPRLYLMITIGSVYMNLEDAPINEILNDMLEMCKGVQNPIRGLFLRYYLIQKTKNYLITYENNDNLHEVINFIISNFIEMNKLWVRLQHQGHSSERTKRIEERNELKILVGSNLVILSQLDLINKDLYNQKILPEILQQIIRCRDSIAQNYLLDVIIQIFPDNFQINSLNIFLKALLMVNNEDLNVDITTLLISLIDRLIDYKKRNPVIIDVSFLKEFIKFIDDLNQGDPQFDIKNYCIILNGILKLSIIYSKEDDDVLDNLNLIYKLSIDKFNLFKSQEDGENSNDGFKIILKSVDNIEDFNNFFKINDESYFKLFNLQTLSIRKEIALSILNNLIENEIHIDNEEKLDKIFKYLNASILVNEETKQISETKKDLFGSSNSNNSSNEIIELDEYFESLNKLLHLIYNKDSKTYYQLLTQCEGKYLTNGNYYMTYPTLINILIKLIRKMNFEKVEKKELINVFNKISKLNCQIKDKLPVKALNLNLNCAQISNECKLNNISYEFFIESFIIYEENIIESKIQIQCLMNIINKLISMDQMIILDVEEFNKLITKATLYGSRLLKKTDQCRAIYNSSHLWWINKEEEEEDEDDEVITEEVEEEDTNQISLKKDDKRVLECLQKSLRIADSIMDNNVSIELFIEILNQSIYYFIHGNDLINVRYLNGLIELIGNNFKEITQTSPTGKIDNTPFASTWKHYQRTLKYIREQRAVDGRFHEISV